MSVGTSPFSVPTGVSAVHLVLVGAPGGAGGASGPAGGDGSQASANLSVTAGQVLDVTLGGAGSAGAVPAGGNGGSNGGGNGGAGSQYLGFNQFAPGGGGGGGATDLRPQGGELSSRLIVAAGGGGSAPQSFGGIGGPGDANGGDGRGPNCGPHDAGGQAGTSTQGGAGGQTAGGGGGDPGGDGSLGQGGIGGGGTEQADGDGAGGGGGGAYGGGGGNGASDMCQGAGGGGGGGSLFGAGTFDPSLSDPGIPQAQATINWMPPAATSPDVVISQVFDFQNDPQAPYTDGYVELFNRGMSAVNVNGWTVQLAGPASPGWAVSDPLPNQDILPGGYMLIAETGTYSHPETLPTPDATVAFENFTDSEKVALTDSSAPLQGNCPTRTSDVIDFVGVGPNADCFEGSGPGSALDSANAATRVGHGCIDTQDNGADFTAAGPVPHNSSSPLFDCSVPLNQTPPTIAGTPQPGHQLTCQHGTWQHYSQLDYQWVQVSDAGTTPLGGETNQTYTVQPTDVGFGLACEDVAMNARGDTTVSSALIAEPGPPQNTGPPQINGAPVIGRQLSCTTGTWSNGPLRYTYRWLRDGSPLTGQTTSHHSVTPTDRETTLSCQVTASNDVGSGLPATSAGVFAVQAKPANISPPTVTLSDTGPRPTDKVATCHPGTWRDDPHDYDFRFQHSAGDVIASTDDTHQVTVDDLGQEITCTVFVHNALGTSSLTSAPVLVPLPPPQLEQGGVHMYMAGGEVNEFDPVNLLATSDGLQKDLRAAQQQRVQQAYDSFLSGCRARHDLSPGPPSTDPRTITDQAERNKALCELLLSTPTDQIRIGPDGVRIESDPNKCVLGTNDPCAVLPIPMPAPFGLPPGQVDSGVVPQEILWDVNSDGKVDAICPGTAPVLRSIYDRGYYNVRAVLVLPGSVDTGEYPSIALTFNHYADTPPPGSKLLRYVGSGVPTPNGAGARSASVPVGLPDAFRLGLPRPTQPFACRTSLIPPPDPVLPCTDEGYIGQVHVEGNLCPISLRRIPKPELDQIRAQDPDLYDLLVAENQSLGLAHDRGRAPPGARASRAAAFPTTPAGAFNLAMQQFAEPTPQKYAVSPAVRDALTRINVPIKQAPFALDQIYISHGPMKVNGVAVDPSGDHAVVLVPSDVGQAVQQVHDMVIASSSAGVDLGGIPLSQDATSSFVSTVNDAVGSGSQQLIPKIDLDSIANDLKSKLDLGPFTLAGTDAQVHIANGVAILDAEAKLPSLSTSPGGAPIETAIQITGQPDGTVKLSGLHLNVPDAYLGAVHVNDLDLTYDGGLTVQGQLLFPPLDTGIDIQEFRIDQAGNFRSLILAYLAGAGEGIPVGPGVFLTKVGGGLTLNPDEIHALATLSVGPSTGGGCPIAGLDGTLVLHFGPPPFFISSNSDIELACFKIGNVHFYADSDGYVTFGGSMGFDGGPLYFNASLDGAIRLPNWQVVGSGEGGIRHVLAGSVHVVISNRGLAGCGSIYVGVDPFGFTLSGGAAVRWNPSLLLGPASIIANLHLFTGCDLSDYQTVVSPAARDGAGPPMRTFTLPSGQRALVLAVQGLGKAPLVTLRGPKGTVVDLTGAAVFTRARTAIGLRQDSEDTAFFIVAHPPAGQWVVQPASSSVPIVKLQQAQVLPGPRITARVSGTGSRRTLTYSVAPITGQTVRFVEQDGTAGQTVATVSGGGRGQVHFTVAPARGTRRRIMAEVQQGGLPRTNLIVATFSAPSPRVGTVRGLQVRRRGTRLLITWKPAALATRYDVVVSLSTGARALFSTTGRTDRVVVPSVAKSTSARISVLGVSALGLRGPVATIPLAAVRKHHHR
jgi:hypothetical protein